MHRFFAEPNDPALFHQLKNVLRLNHGERVILLDNSGYEQEAEIESYEKDHVKFRLLSKQKNENEPELSITLFQALPKKLELFELVLQKATEIGVQKFVPLITARTERKIISKKDRMLRILKEAAEQSGCGKIPILEEPQKFEDALKNLHEQIYLFDAKGEKFSKKTMKETAIAVFIGPEGGFTNEEIEFAKEKSALICSLGKRTLRMETAGIVIPALFLLR